MSLDRIRPICLPISGSMLTKKIVDRWVDQNPFIAGWGIASSDKQEMSPILMQIQVPVITNEQCKSKYDMIPWYETVIDNRVLCTLYGKEGKGGKDSCQGDSGGPLMLPIKERETYPFYQIGIISYGDGCARPNAPGINTNVAFYAGWIKEKLNL